MARRKREERERRQDEEPNAGRRRQGSGQGGYGQDSAYRQREEQRGYAQAGYGEPAYGVGAQRYGDYGRRSREGHEQGGYMQGGYSQGGPGQGGGYSQGGFQPGYGQVQGSYVQGPGQKVGQEPRRGGFRGRGPRGYQRSDERINEEVCQCLCDDDDVDAQDIEVTVASGEVTLNGTVPERHMKRLAEDLVDQISGVQHVQNNLRINREASQSDAGTGKSASAREKNRGSLPR